MVNAIGKLCGGLDGPLIVGSSTITYESDNAYGNAPHPAAIQISGTCGDFEDVSDICMSAGYTLCTAAVNLGTGVKLNLGKDGRQRWAVAGYRPDGWMGMGFKWDDLMAIDKFVEVLPNGKIAARSADDTESSSTPEYTPPAADTTPTSRSDLPVTLATRPTTPSFAHPIAKRSHTSSVRCLRSRGRREAQSRRGSQREVQQRRLQALPGVGVVDEHLRC